MSKSIQQILDEQRATSPIFNKTEQAIAVGVANKLLRTGKSNSVPVWNKGKKGVQQAWNKGIPATAEQRKKMSDSQKGAKRQPHSEETKQKMRDKALARGPRPESMKRKLSATKSKPVMTPDGIFPTRKDAAAFYGITPNGLSVRMKDYPDQYYYIDKNG